MRQAEISRETAETKISLSLNLDGAGRFELRTGMGFFDHMLELFTRHGRFDLSGECRGDLHVDFHHTAEDLGIVLGGAFRQALGDMRGISRYGSFLLPMDEALIQIAVDMGGRAHFSGDLRIPTQKVGEFDTELVEEFLLAFTRSAGCTLHIRQLAGTNSHHIIEAVFKCLGRALAQACGLDSRFQGEIPSTKGFID